jgi:transposase-like protein
MKKVIRIGKKGKVKLAKALQISEQPFDSRIELIQSLIPLGLAMVNEELQNELMELIGAKHDRERRNPDYYRWGQQAGSIYLDDQKFRLAIPRVRDFIHNKEIPLKTYQAFQKPHKMDEGVLKRIAGGLSCRDYEKCAEAVPEAFGLSASTVSRRFIQASSRKLKELMERDLSSYDLVAIFMDGKYFADDEIVMALGVTMKGQKIPLGFIQAGTENEVILKDFLNSLLDRGLNIENGVLCVMDGSKGFCAAVKKVFNSRALIQRCQWHKRENVLKYLPKHLHRTWRKKLQNAYEKPTYDEAKVALNKLKSELKLINESAVRSLEEGMEETLTLHHLGLFDKLGTSFKTTNCIESVMSQVAKYTDKIDYWKNSSQKQRWVATALLEIEPNLRTVKGYRHLPLLRNALKEHLNLFKKAA